VVPLKFPVRLSLLDNSITGNERTKSLDPPVRRSHLPVLVIALQSEADHRGWMPSN